MLRRENFAKILDISKSCLSYREGVSNFLSTVHLTILRNDPPIDRSCDKSLCGAKSSIARNGNVVESSRTTGRDQSFRRKHVIFRQLRCPQQLPVRLAVDADTAL
jgi:hypothetical protein